MKVRDPKLIGYIRSQTRILFNRHSLPRWSVFLLDGGAAFITFIFAYVLRFNFEPFVIDFGLAFMQSLIVVGVYSGFELIFRSQSGNRTV